MLTWTFSGTVTPSFSWQEFPSKVVSPSLLRIQSTWEDPPTDRLLVRPRFYHPDDPDSLLPYLGELRIFYPDPSGYQLATVIYPIPEYQLLGVEVRTSRRAIIEPSWQVSLWMGSESSPTP